MTGRIAAALHRAALRVYPQAFRARLGDDLQQTFEYRHTAARRRGHLAAGVTAVTGIADAVASGLAERLFAHRSLTMSWESVRFDVRLAFRHITRAPLFAAMVIATLAIGIGANSAIFSTVYAVLIKPLPYQDPDGLVAIWSDHTKDSDPVYPVSPANYDAFAREATGFAQVEAMYSFLTNQQVRIGDAVETIQASWVTPGMFRMLGHPALLGRGLQEGDERAVVLSYAYWQRRFGGDRGVIGQPLARSAGGPPFTIVGVMPEEFIFPYRSMLAPSGFSRAQHADLWVLLTPQTGFRMVDATGQPSRTIHMLAVLARLKPGTSFARAEADLKVVAARRERDLPDTNAGFGITMRPLLDQTVGAVRPALVLLTAGVGVLLLLTCVNIANVLLARATGRQRDAAVRAALGASRARLLQQALTESAVLGLLGGMAALVIVALGSEALLALAPADLPRIAETRLSPAVIGFTFFTALCTGIVTGLLPAFTVSRAKADEGLRDSRRTTAGRAQRAARATLVVSEIALATLLTVGAGLLLRSFASVLSVDPGFAPDHLLTFQVSAPPRAAGARGLIQFYDELRTTLQAIPGVTHVGGSTRIPLGSTQVSTQLHVEGRDVPPADLPEVEMRRAVHDYFGTMRIPVRAGRVFTDEDRTAGEGLAVINEALLARVFPGESGQAVVGRRVQMGATPTPNGWLRVIGVVGNVRHTSLEETPEPEIYISHLQGPPSSPFMAIRVAGDAAAATSAVRDAVKSLGADPPSNVRTMEDLRAESVGERRFVMWLTGVFGVVALLLAGVGVYGVIALLVSERTAEVGIRLALGASPGQVWSMLVSHAAVLGAIGVSVGLVAGYVLAPLARTLLFGVSPTDPATFLGVAVLLFLVAVTAAALPARRARHVDPASALRAQ